MAGSVQALLERARVATQPGGPLAMLAPLRKLVSPLVTYRQTYIWFELALGDERPARPLADGFELVAVDESREDDFHRLGSTAPDKTASYRAQGGQPWMVIGRGQPAFGCWIHPRRTPLTALPGGFMELPANVACLEDSVTSPDFRGQGVAPAGWSALAERYRADGFDAFVTKVLDTNAPSCKAVQKAGFREVARMHVKGNGSRVRLRVKSAGTGSGPALVQRLDGATARLS